MKRILCYGLTLFLILRGSAQTVAYKELSSKFSDDLKGIAVYSGDNQNFLVNNSDLLRDQITIYTYNRPAVLSVTEKLYALKVYPNPADETLNIRCNENIEYATVCDMAGHALINAEGRISSLDIRTLPVGIFLLKLRSFDGHEMAVHFIRN